MVHKNLQKHEAAQYVYGVKDSCSTRVLSLKWKSEVMNDDN